MCLQGCSLLPKDGSEEDAEGLPTVAAADGEADPVSTSPSFAVEVRAPDEVRETLERHLELQRFRKVPLSVACGN